MGAVDGIGDPNHRGIEIEFAAVLGDSVVAWEGQAEVAERLVLHLLEGAAHHGATEQIVRRRDVAGEQQALDFRQRAMGSDHHRVVGAAGPEGFFVELDDLVAGATEYHRAEAAIPDRKGLVPVFGGLPVPEAEIRPDPAGRGEEQQRNE